MTTKQKTKNWHVQFRYGDQHSYATAAGVIGYVNVQINNLKDFCIKFNSEGLETLEAVKDRVGDIQDMFTFGGIRELEVNEVFDKHSNGKLMFKVWKTND